MRTEKEIQAERARLTRMIKHGEPCTVIDLASARYALLWLFNKALWSPSQFAKEFLRVNRKED